MEKRILALKANGELDYCDATSDCGHILHQNPNETREEFLERADKVFGVELFDNFVHTLKKSDKKALNIEMFKDALYVLDAKLKKLALTVDIKAIGGFALLWHNLRESGVTVDIDTVTRDYTEPINQAIRETSQELNLPIDWINNDNILDDPEIVDEMLDAFYEKADLSNDIRGGFTNINLMVADLETLFVSKLMAVDDLDLNHRIQDVGDTIEIMNRLGYTMKNIDNEFPRMKLEFPRAYHTLKAIEENSNALDMDFIDEIEFG